MTNESSNPAQPDPKSPVQFEGVTLHKRDPVTGRVTKLLYEDLPEGWTPEMGVPPGL